MSKSPSSHEENQSQGIPIDEGQREAEEECQISGGILNSADNSIAGGTRGSNYFSKNTSRACSRGGSGRTTREGSPAIRSGTEPSGNASCEPARPSRYASEASRQGIPQAATYFENYLKTGSPLADYPHDFISPSSRAPQKCSPSVRFVDLNIAPRPLSEPCDSFIRPSLHIAETIREARNKKKLPEMSVGKKSFDDGSYRSSLQVQKSRLLGTQRTVPYKSFSRNTSISRNNRIPFSYPVRRTTDGSDQLFSAFSGVGGQRKISSSVLKKSVCPSRTSIKYTGTPRVSAQLKACPTYRKDRMDHEKANFQCYSGGRPPSIPRDICPINRCLDPCAPVVDPCPYKPPDILMPAPSRGVRKPASAGKNVCVSGSPPRRRGPTRGTTEASNASGVCKPGTVSGGREVSSEKDRQNMGKQAGGSQGEKNMPGSGIESGRTGKTKLDNSGLGESKAPGSVRAGTGGIKGGIVADGANLFNGGLGVESNGSKPKTLGTGGATKSDAGGATKSDAGGATKSDAGGATKSGTQALESLASQDVGKKGLLGFGDKDKENKALSSSKPFPAGQFPNNVGQTDPDRLKEKADKDARSVNKNTGAKDKQGLSSDLDDSSKGQGTGKPCGVSFAPLSRGSPQREPWTGYPDRSQGSGKTISVCNKASSGAGGQSPFQGFTKLGSPSQGTGSSGQRSGSPSRFDDSFGGGTAKTSKTPSCFVEEFGLGPECSPAYSKSQSRHTASRSHVDEISSKHTARSVECSAPCSRAASRFQADSPKYSKGPSRLQMSASRTHEWSDNYFSSTHHDVGSGGHGSECPSHFTEHSPLYPESSRNTSHLQTPHSRPVSECLTPYVERSQYIYKGSGHQSEQLTASSNPVSECAESGVRYSQGSGHFSRRSPEPVSEGAVRFSDGSERFHASSGHMSENMAQYSAVSDQYSHGHVSECAGQSSQAFGRLSSSPTRFLAESPAPDFEFAAQFSENHSHFSESSDRVAQTSTRIFEPLGIIPESPGRNADTHAYQMGPPSYSQYSPPLAETPEASPPYSGPSSCSGKALKCLTRLNADPNEKRRSRISNGDNLCEFVTICNPSYKGTTERRLPKKPELSQDELEMLVQDETDDVEFTRCITADVRKTNKKPCTKQTKAQMQVKHLIHSLDVKTSDPCPKDYGPLVDPDPEDLSPEVAAAMMFSQEQGIKLESCPAETIKHLFPDEKSPCDKIPASKVSVVDSSQKDQEEMIEKSASVPSEGVSDSAYTKTMKQKSDDMGSKISYELDLEVGQGKREYVLVSRKPQRFNKIQYRGNDPSWFPGYFSAFPGEEGIKIISSPSTVFIKAWSTTNPGTMPASDVTVID